jgi:hypothetical protein
MAYQLTPPGVSVLALLRERPMHGYQMSQTLLERLADRVVRVRPGSLYHTVDRLTEEKLIRVRELVATPAHEFPRFLAALAGIHNLDVDTALDAIDSRVAALEASVAEMTALRDAGIAPAGNLLVLEYLLTTTQGQVTWLRAFAESLRSGRRQWRHAARLDAIHR